MNIRVNLISKEVYTLALPIEKPADFVNKIRPAEIFNRSLHQFLGKVRTVSINPDYIEWIEFDTNELPKTASLSKAITIRQLSQESFNSWVNKQKESIAAVIKSDVEQNVLLAY